MEIQTTNEELDLAPQPTFNEIQTILQTMDEEAYDVIDSNQLLKELKTEGYQCQYCSKVLATKYSLQMHTRLHTGEKPHQCSLCEARFSHPTDLRRHLLKHTGEKPYACDVCGAKFTQSGSLKGLKCFYVKQLLSPYRKPSSPLPSPSFSSRNSPEHLSFFVYKTFYKRERGCIQEVCSLKITEF